MIIRVVFLSHPSTSHEFIINIH